MVQFANNSGAMADNIRYVEDTLLLQYEWSACYVLSCKILQLVTCLRLPRDDGQRPK